jgi:hypothetical protein
MSEPVGPQLPGFAARIGIELEAEAGDDALVASGQVRLWQVADHPEGWRSR